MSELAKTHSAEAEESEVTAASSADRAAIVAARLELRLALLFFDQTLFCHTFSRRYRGGMRGLRTDLAAQMWVPGRCDTLRAL